MALEGSLQDFGLADILQLIYFQRKTGLLTLEGRMDRVRLFFVDGNIAGAESRRRLDDNRLGKILVKKNIITDAELQAALEEQRSAGGKLGGILLNRGVAQKELVQDILRNQIHETVTQLFSWKQGSYSFEAQGISQDRDFPFSLDTQHLLMDGLRIMDEWSLIKGKITLDMVFGRISDPPSGLMPDEKEVLACVDGENDVSTIVDLTGQDNFEVSKTLISLVEKGIISSQQQAPEVAMEAPVAVAGPSALVGYAPYIALVTAFVLALIVPAAKTGDMLKEVRAARQIGQIRFAIEAYRLEHSAYPQQLDALSQSADPWGRPYIYRPAGAYFSLSSAGVDGAEQTEDDIF